jgi:lipopolysaccharide assembly outer membrane protein LptD (OstA)
MNKKIIIQIALFLILIIIFFFFYYKYFSSETTIKNSLKPAENIKLIETENNLIKKLEYLSTDKKGNKYLITAEYGEISNTDGNIILMTNVEAELDFLKKDTVYLSSDFAKYNTLNLDTNFNKNVILNYTEHEVTSENMDLSFKNNFVWVYNNIVYKSSTNQLFADKLEIDLLSKDSKIFMYNKKKVKIIGK